ncbi:MAG TPA: sulfate ABC transporter substrate-binding protein [Terriglobales bacterium]|nr:sulfate ABC transporter substrate-binding protein [Terriglobales bacterium]
MRTLWLNAIAVAAVALAMTLVVVKNVQGDASNQLLNVSYDPTRELFQDLNRQFSAQYARQTGKKITIQQSHGGSSRQAQAVIDGLEGDVVTLALPSDVEALHKHGLIADGWAARLPNNSQPYSSTIVFVVRKGNPRNIRDWPDLVGPGISVITPDPKTSGNGKLSVLAAWGSVIYRGGTEAQALQYLKELYQHVPAFGSGARDATNTFTQEKLGDVHLTWENEALLEREEYQGDLEIIYPPVSIRAEPSVAWVDSNVARRKNEAYAKAYLDFLYTEQAQEAIARHGYRPINPEVLKRHRDRLPQIELFPVSILAKDWDEAQQKFFADNGIFNVIHPAKTKQNQLH